MILLYLTLDIYFYFSDWIKYKNVTFSKTIFEKKIIFSVTILRINKNIENIKFTVLFYCSHLEFLKIYWTF